jgi:hypothetical protein
MQYGGPMTAVRLLSFHDILSRLAPYGGQREMVLPDGTELWKTGWNFPFMLRPEHGGMYDEWQYTRAVGAIGPTIPEDWNDDKPYDGEDDD